MNNNIYLIEDGFNTNYISCLLVSMFLNKNILYNLLLEKNDISNDKLYFQELIKFILFSLKSYRVINSDILNNFRNILGFNKFLSNTNFLLNNPIENLYEFLLKTFNCNKIEFLNINNNSSIENYYYLNIDVNSTYDNLKSQLLESFKYKILNNIPDFIGIKLNRNFNNNIILDIQKKITFKSIYNFNNINIETGDNTKLIWNVFSIICYEPVLDLYYSFINISNNWFYFNQKELINIQIINIKEYESQIKLQAYFLIYTFDNKMT
jgi:hypothetical protein